MEKICKKCGESKPQTSEFFNLLPSGNWRGTCKKCMASNTRKHYHQDPQKVLDRVNKYKEQKAAAGGGYTQDDIEKLRAAQNDNCAYCGVPLNGGGEIDHRMPISRGGDNFPENLALACRTCNRDKHAKSDVEFMAWRKLRFSKSIDNKIN